MTIQQLLFKFGIAGLFGVTRQLHEDNERLRQRVESLEIERDELYKLYRNDLKEMVEKDDQLSFELLRRKFDLDDDGYPNEDEKPVVVPPTEERLDPAKVKPFSRHKGSHELMKEARQRYDLEIEMKKAAAQEALVDEVQQQEEPQTPAVKLSKAKTEYYVDAGRRIMEKTNH